MNALSRALIRSVLPVRREVLRRRVGRLVLEHVEGLDLLVLPDVFNPSLFRTSALLAHAVGSQSVRPGADTALDMGTGSGIAGLAAARLGYRVTAVDVNPEAVRCARINALLNRLGEAVEVVQGDLFGPVQGRRYDLVLFNPPFFRGVPRSARDAAWRATDVLDRFAGGLPCALAPGGRALVVFSTDGDTAGLMRAFGAAGMSVHAAVERDCGNELLTVYEVTAR